MESSSIVNMEIVNSDDESDYGGDNSFQDSSPDRKTDPAYSSKSDQNEPETVSGQMTKGVATYVWQEGRQRATKAFNLYANIDILRPYFDVEPQEVRNRYTWYQREMLPELGIKLMSLGLLSSLIPKIPNSQGPQTRVPRELYGPTMLVLTLIAMLLMQMKTSDVIVQEGTLMGTSFGVCFGYWFGISGLLWLTGYVSNTRLAMLQILHLLGYSLFGHCIVIFLTTVFHPNYNHLFFYVAWLVFGGLSTLKVVSVLMSRTPGRTQQMILCAIVVLLHLGFLLYLHFAYHKIVEEISEAIIPGNQNLIQQEAQPANARNEIPAEGLMKQVTEKLNAAAEVVFKSDEVRGAVK